MVAFGETSTSTQPTRRAKPSPGRTRQRHRTETDKLSALIAAKNEKFGADFGEADTIWLEQQCADVLASDELREIAQHNDQSGYELVLADLLGRLILERHDGNGALVDMFFEEPEWRCRERSGHE